MELRCNIDSSFISHTVTCASAYDIVFVIDASGSVGSRDFQLTLDFLVDMVQHFSVDSISGVQVYKRFT